MALARGILDAFLKNLGILIMLVAPLYFVASWLWLNRTDLKMAFPMLPDALVYNLILFVIPLILGCTIHIALVGLLTSLRSTTVSPRSASILVSVTLAVVVVGVVGFDNLHSLGTVALWFVAAFVFGALARVPQRNNSF